MSDKKRDFITFIRQYKNTKEEIVYLEKIHEMITKREISLQVDFKILYFFNHILANYILDKPLSSILDGNMVVKSFVEKFDPKYGKQNKEFFIRFYNLNESNKVQLQNIRSEHEEKLVSIDCLIKESSEANLQLLDGFWECDNCGKKIKERNDIGFEPKQPKRCPNPNCKKSTSFNLNEDRSTFIDVQELIVKELDENINENTALTTKSAYITKDLLSNWKKGDKVNLIAIPYIKQESLKKSSYKIILIVNNITKK